MKAIELKTIEEILLKSMSERSVRMIMEEMEEYTFVAEPVYEMEHTPDEKYIDHLENELGKERGCKHRLEQIVFETIDREGAAAVDDNVFWALYGYRPLRTGTAVRSNGKYRDLEAYETGAWTVTAWTILRSGEPVIWVDGSSAMAMDGFEYVHTPRPDLKQPDLDDWCGKA